MIRLLLILSLILLTACAEGRFQKVMGIQRSVPDEFKVVSGPPLSLPPEFSLKPPASEQNDIAESDITRQTKELLFGGTYTASPSLTTSEQFFISQTNVKKPVENIRDLLDQEAEKEKQAKAEKPFLEKLLAYASPDKTKEPLVNASKERDRIVKTEELDEPLTGEETPIAVEKDGFITKVFGR